MFNWFLPRLAMDRSLGGSGEAIPSHSTHKKAPVCDVRWPRSSTGLPCNPGVQGYVDLHSNLCTEHKLFSAAVLATKHCTKSQCSRLSHNNVSKFSTRRSISTRSLGRQRDLPSTPGDEKITAMFLATKPQGLSRLLLHPQR